MPNFISEDQIEQALLQKRQHVHGYDILECGTAKREDLADGSNRTSKREVILIDRLRAAAVALNPTVPATRIEAALERVTDRRTAMSPVVANREVYELIRDGVPLEYDNKHGEKRQVRG